MLHELAFRSERAAPCDECVAAGGRLRLVEDYDAEYVALAQLLACRLVTLDIPLRRGTDRLGLVVAPIELVERAARLGPVSEES